MSDTKEPPRCQGRDGRGGSGKFRNRGISKSLWNYGLAAIPPSLDAATAAYAFDLNFFRNFGDDRRPGIGILDRRGNFLGLIAF